MRLVYFFPTDLPNPHSHSIQTLRTCLALARAGMRVELTVAKLHASPEEVLAHYGLAPEPGFSLATFARPGSKLNRWSGRSFRIAARTRVLARGLDRETVFYIRGTARALDLITTIGPLCRRMDRPLIFEIHGIQYRDLRQTHRGRYGEGDVLESYIESRRQLEARAYARVSGFVSISTRLRELLKEEFSIERPTLIAPSGVDLPADAPPPLAARDIPIAYVGGLYEFNGVDLLIKALATLPGVRAAIVGGGSDEQVAALRALAERLGVADRLTWTGQVAHAEAQAWMRRARILVAPLRPSGRIDRVSWCSPGKVVEYMAAGAAIVASDLPNLRDALEDGRNALLVEPNNPAALADALARLLEDDPLAQRLAAAAQKEAPRYTFETRAGGIISFIKSIGR